ncbi:VWA domain-containing protein [uncultured Sphingomonas sp.]|uniref:VWA domain-containing protein n=1 Tax=uncultured Sphingomonas sp. TaxID=158754 RepID=UPI0035C97283
MASGLAPEAIAAARTYLEPFTRADQGACFSEVESSSADLEAPAAAVFASSPQVTRVVVAIDGSGSMATFIGTRSKLALAKEATLAFIGGLSEKVPASVLVFGQQGSNNDSGKAASCRGIDQLAPMSLDRDAQRRAVASVRAVGWTPLAAALQKAQAQLGVGAPGEQVIYVVSDGNETCGGDPVAIARAINTGQTRAIVNIIGFDLPAADRAALTEVARAGGGTLINVADDTEYRRMLAATREAGRLTMNTVRASGARSRNLIDTSAATTRATICIGDIITRETLAVGTDLTRRATAKQDAPDRRVVFAVLDQRHKALTAKREAFEARLKGERDRSNDAIDVQEEAAR